MNGCDNECRLTAADFGEVKINVFNVTISIALAVNKLLCRINTVYATADHK